MLYSIKITRSLYNNLKNARDSAPVKNGLKSRRYLLITSVFSKCS